MTFGWSQSVTFNSDRSPGVDVDSQTAYGRKGVVLMILLSIS